ncbi:T9SS type A sorting domain-containing protein [Winogradskyella vidalii]|uniref:T9SS type A sorting domain-containing protein n=1 Tax=Winogradskyella vidalii TaxID=2615024 RepID=UPI0015CB67CE|nr:T9SS type A sorting domain-containing protein [Winogradskyella vidalii]
MTKKLLCLSLILTSFICQAQFDVIYKRNNSIVTDGQTYTFTDAQCEYTDPCNWTFKVTNTSTEDIYMKVIVDELVNNDGSNFQVCFASVCLYNISLGSAYPSTAALITPGATNDQGNSLWNLNDPDTTTNMSWTLRFQAYDAADNEIGTPISVTYNYQPTLSIEDSEISNLKVFPTEVKDELNVSVDENISAVFYDITGKKVKEVQVLSGNQKIMTSDLSSQIYFVHFKNEAGLKTVVKIAKK